MADAKARLISRTLYRSLLRTSKHFTEHSSKGVLLCSLLYRTGEDDDRIPTNYHESTDGKLLYKSLVSKIIGQGKHLNFPSTLIASMQQHDNINNIMNRLRTVIQVEFRDTVECHTEHIDGDIAFSHRFSDLERRNAAFLGLKQLNKKLQYAKTIGIFSTTSVSSKYDIGSSVQRTTEIQPGTYLIAHPLLGGYFSKCVVVILEHSSRGGTYGLVINRPSFIYDTSSDLLSSPSSPSSPSSHKKRRNLSETIRTETLPILISKAFGKCSILEGGPLNLSIQMMRRDTGRDDEGKPDGNVLQFRDGEKIYFGGDLMKASQAVVDEKVHSDDFVFIAGASCWETGQLEREIDQGYWMLVEGPPLFDKLRFTITNDDAMNETWISFIRAISKEDAQLAMAMRDDLEDEEEDGTACDSF